MKPFLDAIHKPRVFMPVFAVLALLLSIPSLNNGLQFDDLSHRIIMLNQSEAAAKTHDGSLFGLYSFVDGNAQRTHYLMDQGVLPWWTFPELKYTFFRPLTELSIWLDYQLWSDDFKLMHLQNSLWFMFSVLACVFYFRQIYAEQMPGKYWLILIPGLFFLLSGTHAITISWIAARNALIAMSFGLLAAGTHVRYYQNKNLVFYALTMLFLLMSMAAGEIGISSCAFIAAYGLFFSPSPFVKRCLEISPFVLLTLGWIALRSYLGFGAYGSGYYLDPVNDAALFIPNILESINYASAALWTGIPVELFVSPPLSDIQYIFVYFIIFNLFLLTAFFPFWKKNRRAWFYLFVLMLCLVPVSGSTISSRVLTFACVPAFAFMAEVLVSFWLQRHTFFKNSFLFKSWQYVLSGLAALSLFSHLIIAPLILWHSQTLLVSQFDPLLNIPARILELPEDISNKKLILLNPPNATIMSYLPLIQRLEGKDKADNTWMLSSGYAGVKVSRPDANTLELEPKDGFLAEASEQIFRSSKFPMKVGEQIKLKGMTVSILSINEQQRPQRVSFYFEHELENNLYVFKSWTKQDGMAQFGDFKLPEIGEAIELAPALAF